MKILLILHLMIRYETPRTSAKHIKAETTRGQGKGEGEGRGRLWKAVPSLADTHIPADEATPGSCQPLSVLGEPPTPASQCTSVSADNHRCHLRRSPHYGRRPPSGMRLWFRNPGRARGRGGSEGRPHGRWEQQGLGRRPSDCPMNFALFKLTVKQHYEF